MKQSRENGKNLTILARAVESAGEGFVTIDENHRVVFLNRAAEKLFGYRRQEILGRDLNEILAPSCSRDHRAAVERYLRSKKPRLRGHARELTATRKGGQTFPCAIAFSVSRLGGKVFFTGIVHDLSDAKALQEEMAQRRRMAELGGMVAEINHEIRNPLMIIGGFVQRLTRNATDSRTLAQLSIIAAEVQRIERLVEELRRLYLPRNLRMKNVDMVGILREVHLMAEEACREKNIRLESTLDPGPLRVRADPEKVKQVLINLVRNAVEAMDKEGTLRLAIARADDKVTVTVADNGHGIPDKVRPRIFDPFFTTKKGGSGLGLPVCRRIIEDHRGWSMHLISREGEGTTAQIQMPLHRPGHPLTNRAGGPVK